MEAVILNADCSNEVYILLTHFGYGSSDGCIARRRWRNIRLSLRTKKTDKIEGGKWKIDDSALTTIDNNESGQFLIIRNLVPSRWYKVVITATHRAFKSRKLFKKVEFYSGKYSLCNLSKMIIMHILKPTVFILITFNAYPCYSVFVNMCIMSVIH